MIDLADLEAKVRAATQGEWAVWAERTQTEDDAISEFAYQVRQTDPFVGVTYLINADGKCPATTGCGPTSRANAAYIVAAQPSVVLELIERVKTLEEALRIALPYVEAQVNDDGGIDNCEISDRLAYERGRKALGGSNE